MSIFYEAIQASEIEAKPNKSIRRGGKAKITKVGRQKFSAKETKMNIGPRYIALTFDDGPHAIYTPQILNILENYNAKATFFVLGERIRGQEAILRRMVRGGNEIGNHTWDHQDLTSLSRNKIEKEVLADQKIILACANYQAKLFRPPYGAYNNSSKKAVGMPFALWTVDTLDWRDRNAKIIAERVMRGAKNGSIILLHDIHPTTLEAVKVIIPKLKAAGFVFVTVSELEKVK